MVIERGEIWWAEPPPRGSKPRRRRPIVVVQSDDFNRSRIGTVVAVTVTSNERVARAPGNFELPIRTSGLGRDSVVNIAQIVTIDQQFLVERLGALTSEQIRRLDTGLRLVLAL